MGISHFSILIPGNFAADDPFTGLEDTLQLFELAEELGYDSAWVRQRHLERGVSSAATFLAAATQRTRRIGLGSAVIQLGYENPFRLAEDLATVDVLSQGRLNVGVSAGPAPFAHLLPGYLPQWPEGESRYAVAEKLAQALRSEPLSDQSEAGNAAGDQVPRLHPHAKGLTDRLWYGAGSTASAEWAGRNGWKLLTGNVITAESHKVFLRTQGDLIRTYRESWQGAGQPQVALGRVLLPTDTATPAQRAKYAAFVERRLPRTCQPNGPRNMMFLSDLTGTADQIMAALSHDPILPQVDHLRLELPYEFEAEDYRQILRDFAGMFYAFR